MSLNTTNPNTYVKFIFLQTSPLIPFLLLFLPALLPLFFFLRPRSQFLNNYSYNMHQLIHEPAHLNNEGKPTSLLDLASPTHLICRNHAST